jgi:hypothetical protein
MCLGQMEQGGNATTSGNQDRQATRRKTERLTEGTQQMYLLLLAAGVKPPGAVSND